MKPFVKKSSSKAIVTSHVTKLFSLRFHAATGCISNELYSTKYDSSFTFQILTFQQQICGLPTSLKQKTEI